MDSPAVARAPGDLPGDFAIWMFIFAELTAFGLLFAVYAVVRASHLQAFAAAQAVLDRRFGLATTLMLLSSGYAVARAQRAVAAARSRQATDWLGGALLLGTGFVVLKLAEFHADAARGVDFGSGLFDMFYVGLSVFHFMHVLLGLVILGVVAVRIARRPGDPAAGNAVETGGAYWHMVDLIWLVLFYLFYVLH